MGVRHLINVEPDPDWIIRPDVLKGLRIVPRRRLTFDYVGILPRHLQHVPLVAHRVPDLRIVIDHLGKPPIVAGAWEPWNTLFVRASQTPQTIDYHGASFVHSSSTFFFRSYGTPAEITGLPALVLKFAGSLRSPSVFNNIVFTNPANVRPAVVSLG